MEEEKAKSSILALMMMMMMILMMGTGVHGCGHSLLNHEGAPIRKLFVFGDSFADTGNLGKIGWAHARSWLYPYGTTFPHWPTGRFSDGRVLTDFFASFLGNKSPIPYKYRRIGRNLLPYGMNFAVGGSGVFDTGNQQRNLTAQINAFESQIIEGVFSHCDLKSSVAMVSISGNDYSYYFQKGGESRNISAFMGGLISQLKSDLKRLADIGVKNVVVTNQFPLGCTPLRARPSNYTVCNGGSDMAVDSHNYDLQGALDELRRTTNRSRSAFLALDLHTAFESLIDPDEMKGGRRFKHTLKPCCDGKTNNTICGQRDAQGAEQYTLCGKPEDYFFWDDVHPTQAGWAAVFEQLKPSLRKFLT